jgi:uncharacterized protein
LATEESLLTGPAYSQLQAMQRPARIVEWVIEASTFCNMRCAYCYQWEGLADQRRMPLILWEKIFRAACDYHHLLEAQQSQRILTRIIWHGGEPLSLPLDYLKRTFELKNEVVAAAGITPADFTSAMQTNLYSVSDSALELLKSHNVGFGVSFDVVRGVRLGVNGRTTEDRVLTNLDRVRSFGLQCGAITVLAQHTCSMICDIFDFWVERGIPFRVLPLFAGPPSRDAARYSVTENEMARALCRLFDHRMKSTASIAVKPLDEWFDAVTRHLLGLSVDGYDRRRCGESVLVVRPDGNLFQVAEVGERGLALGNLSHQSMAEILGCEVYRASLDRSELVTHRRCADCRFHRACDFWPAHTAAVEHPPDARCHVAYRVHEYMEMYLRLRGVHAEALRDMVASAPPSGRPSYV